MSHNIAIVGTSIGLQMKGDSKFGRIWSLTYIMQKLYPSTTGRNGRSTRKYKDPSEKTKTSSHV